jgi:hypothetical protein
MGGRRRSDHGRKRPCRGRSNAIRGDPPARRPRRRWTIVRSPAESTCASHRPRPPSGLPSGRRRRIACSRAHAVGRPGQRHDHHGPRDADGPLGDHQRNRGEEQGGGNSVPPPLSRQARHAPSVTSRAPDGHGLRGSFALRRVRTRPEVGEPSRHWSAALWDQPCDVASSCCTVKTGSAAGCGSALAARFMSARFSDQVAEPRPWHQPGGARLRA